MSGIYLNNIDMDIFLKYFTKDKLEGSSQELVNYDEKVLIKTFTIGNKYVFNTVDLSMSAPTDIKEYGCYDNDVSTTVKTSEAYCEPYMSVSAIYGDYHTFITKSKYTYVKRDGKVYPYANLEDDELYLTTSSTADIVINRKELLTEYTSKYYIDGVNTYEIYTNSGLDGYLIENQRLYKNICNEKGMLYKTKNGELLFLSSGKSDTRFKRFIRALRTDDVNSNEYQNNLLFSIALPYEIIKQKNVHGSVKEILNNEEKYKELLEDCSSITNEFDDYTEMKVHLTYDKEPLPYSRPRFVRRGKHIGTYNERDDDMKKIRHHFQNSLNIEEKNLIYKIISNGEKYNYYVKVEGKFYIKIPKVANMKNHVLMEKGIMRPTVRRGDVDNYIKLALDVLHEVVYDDDTHVTDISAGKYYSDNPRTELDITIYYNKKIIE